MAEPFPDGRQRMDFVLSSIVWSLVVVMAIITHLGLVSVTRPVRDACCRSALGLRRLRVSRSRTSALDRAGRFGLLL